jgi:hypothetical protein
MSPNTCKIVLDAAAAKTAHDARFALQRAARAEFLGSSDGNVRVDIDIRGIYHEEQSVEATIGLGAVILAPEKAVEVAAELQRAILLAGMINAVMADKKWRRNADEG